MSQVNLDNILLPKMFFASLRGFVSDPTDEKNILLQQAYPLCYTVFKFHVLLNTTVFCESLWSNTTSCCVCLNDAETEQEIDFITVFSCLRHWICFRCSISMILTSKCVCPQCRCNKGPFVIPSAAFLKNRPDNRKRLFLYPEEKRNDATSPFYFIDDHGKNRDVTESVVKKEFFSDFCLLRLMCELQKQIHQTLALTTTLKTMQLALDESNVYIESLQRRNFELEQKQFELHLMQQNQINATPLFTSQERLDPEGSL